HAHEEPHHVMAMLSYLGILFLIPLLMDKHHDEFVLFHLRQGIVMFALEVLASMLFWNRNAGDMLTFALIVVSLVAAYRTYKSEKWVLPIVGQYAQRIKL
ncbi:MAG: hypothetical protein RLZZ324_200, partial [Candidatus Parcubacteria bacterium]